MRDAEEKCEGKIVRGSNLWVGIFAKLCVYLLKLHHEDIAILTLTMDVSRIAEASVVTSAPKTTRRTPLMTSLQPPTAPSRHVLRWDIIKLLMCDRRPTRFSRLIVLDGHNRAVAPSPRPTGRHYVLNCAECNYVLCFFRFCAGIVAASNWTVVVVVIASVWQFSCVQLGGLFCCGRGIKAEGGMFCANTGPKNGVLLKLRRTSAHLNCFLLNYITYTFITKHIHS